jgi:hypothetical protein
MTTSAIIMMIIVLGIFWGGFAGLILRLKKVSDDSED